MKWHDFIEKQVVIRDGKSSKSYCNFFSQPDGGKSEDTFHATLSTFRTFSVDDLANTEDLQSAALMVLSFHSCYSASS